MTDELYAPRVNADGTYETLSIVKEGPIDWLTLNRPAALNAMSRTMMLELQHYFGALYTDHSVRVVLVTGAGRGIGREEERQLAAELGAREGARGVLLDEALPLEKAEERAIEFLGVLGPRIVPRARDDGECGAFDHVRDTLHARRVAGLVDLTRDEPAHGRRVAAHSRA